MGLESQLLKKAFLFKHTTINSTNKENFQNMELCHFLKPGPETPDELIKGCMQNLTYPGAIFIVWKKSDSSKTNEKQVHITLIKELSEKEAEWGLFPVKSKQVKSRQGKYRSGHLTQQLPDGFPSKLKACQAPFHDSILNVLIRMSPSNHVLDTVESTGQVDAPF